MAPEQPWRGRRPLDGSVIAAFDVVSMGAVLLVLLPVSLDDLGCVVLLFGLFAMNGCYRRPRVALTALTDMRATVITAASPLCLVGAGVGFGWVDESLARFAAGVVPAIAVGRVLSYRTIRAMRRRGARVQDAVIYGSGELVDRLTRAFAQSPELGLRIIGHVDDEQPARGANHLGRIADLDDVLKAHGVRNLVVGFSATADATAVATFRSLRSRPLEVFVVPRLYEWGSAAGDMRTQDCAGTPIVWLPHREWRREQLALKRTSDILMALTIMVLGSPLFFACALAVRCSGPGPVVFRQLRVGKDGVVFEMLKFRTMHHEPSVAHTQGGGGDPRITRVGRVLRRTSLDEIPQMWNVLRGDMAMVGPRPEQVTFAAECGQRIPGYADRHRVRVGVTGWAQINRLRGVGSPLEERARYDNYYIEHWSMWRDAAIVLRTITASLRGS